MTELTDDERKALLDWCHSDVADDAEWMGHLYFTVAGIIAARTQTDERMPMTRFGPQVQGRCPTCGVAALFLGAGGYVTCGNLPCSRPDHATDLLDRDPTPAVRGAS